MAVANRVEDVVCDFIQQAIKKWDDAPVTLSPDAEWQKLRAAGTELWLDTGDIDAAKKSLTAEFTALTTNNTLLNKEIQRGVYDETIAEASAALKQAVPEISQQEQVLEIAFILNALHAQRLVNIFGLKVSVELHTDLALELDASVTYGRRYHRINPEMFIVKVPLTPAGYLSARRLKADGIPINFTLGFSARHNYVAARVAKVDYVNVFMGRLGAFVADNGLGDGSAIGEKTTLASQRALIALRQSGDAPTKQIGASMRTGEQVPALAGLDVYTMPPGVADGYREAPQEAVPPRIEEDPPVPLADGVQAAQFGAVSCWEISDAFKAAVDALVAQDLDGMTGDALQDHFHAQGLGGFLPRWSDADLATSREEGKIPKLENWKDRLASGAVALEALMNLAALQSFTTDQEAMDARVREHLG